MVARETWTAGTEHRDRRGALAPGWSPVAGIVGLLPAVRSLTAAVQPDTTTPCAAPRAVMWPAVVVVGFSLVSLLAWVVMRFVGPRLAPGSLADPSGAQDSHDTTLLPLAVTSAIAIIEKRYAEPLTAAALGAEVHVRPEDLDRLFRESTGKSAAEYLDTHRMERAVELIKTTRLEIAEVQLRVGIHDPARFGELFRAATGMTAADYVREYRGVRRQG